jgi:invasion protein IalB
MRTSLLSVTLFSLLATSALANEPVAAPTPEPNELAESAAPAPQLPTKKLPGLATLVAPGETIASGDLIAISRQFENWTLMCDYRLSQNKRICVMEQAIANEYSQVRWRVATTVERKPLLVISLPAHFVLSSGLRLGFAELEKTIPEAEWFCTAQTCITGFPFEGFVQAAIQSSQEVSFSFSVRTNDDKEIDLRLVGNMQGFADAVKAATTDPFGKDIVQNAVVENKPASEPAKAVETTKKPVVQPKTSKVERPSKPAVREARNDDKGTRKPSVGLY